MTDVDSLTDSQLRTKLIEYGFPVMPITGTTRQVMKKKLKLLMENKNKLATTSSSKAGGGKKDKRRSLGRYSSEEDDDELAERSNLVTRNRRVTMGAAVPSPLMQPPSTSSTTRLMRATGRGNLASDNHLDSPMPPPPQQQQREIKSVSTITSTRTAKLLENASNNYKNNVDEFDTGSESNEVADQLSFDNHRNKRVGGRSSISPVKLTDFNATSSPLYRYSMATDGNSSLGLDSSADRLNQIRSRLSLGGAANINSSYNSMYGSPISSIPTTTTTREIDDLLEDRENTPFLSNFTKRLSQLSEKPKPLSSYSNYRNSNDVVKENDLNGAGGGGVGAWAKSTLNSYRSSFKQPLYSGGSGTAAATSRLSNRSNYYDRNSSELFRNFSIPCAVLVFAVLFFVFLSGMYLYMGMNTNATDSAIEAPATAPFCSHNNPHSYRYVNCILEENLNDVKNLLKVLLPELTKRAINAKCGIGGDSPSSSHHHHRSYMTELEIINFIQTNYAVKDAGKIESDLKNLEVLSFVNPKWGIFVAKIDRHNNDNDDDNVVITDKHVMKNMESLAFKDDSDKTATALIILNPALPWKCRITNFVYLIWNFTLFLIVGVTILYLINYSYKYYQYSNQKYNQEIVSMVENIIDILQSNSSIMANDNNITVDNSNDDDHNNISINNNMNFMIINHVRDMILPIEDRKRKKYVWNGAVKYIADFESRIRTEIQVIQGETCEVWRWLGGLSSGSPRGGGGGSAANNNKSWQGQAFETQIGSVNSLQCSPTPCLKIRGMFNESDHRNTQSIKKAVLSKCANQCRILHCAVDTNTNCVYLKCADQSDAAIAYRNLHGWWYSKNLVTVKYLRLERYMQRFPDSPASGPPFLDVPS